MSGPIVRSGPTPTFSKNWEGIFGKKTAKKAAAPAVGTKGAASTKKKAAGKKKAAAPVASTKKKAAGKKKK